MSAVAGLAAPLALCLVTVIALWAAAVDFLYMRIPNGVHVALAAVFAVLVLPGLPWTETAARLGVAAAVFGIGLALYARGLLGAGDVKYLAAAALFVPAAPEVVLAWLVLITMAGLPVFALHRLVGLAAAGGRFPSFSEAGYFPYGPAISIGLVTMLILTGAPG